MFPYDFDAKKFCLFPKYELTSGGKSKEKIFIYINSICEKIGIMQYIEKNNCVYDHILR